MYIHKNTSAGTSTGKMVPQMSEDENIRAATETSSKGYWSSLEETTSATTEGQHNDNTKPTHEKDYIETNTGKRKHELLSTLICFQLEMTHFEF